MFVKSNMSREVRFNKSTGSIVLKPNTVTYVDDNLATAKELKDCYGDRISIMSREVVEKLIVETAPEITEEVIEGVKEVEPAVTTDVVGDIETVNTEVKEEKKEEVKVDPVTELEDVVGDIETVNTEVKEDLISDTGNEEVDAFLNGETDKVPEGTQEISEEEALKLQEEVKEDKKEEEVKEEKKEEVKPAKKATSKKSGKKTTGKKASKK